MTVSLVYEMHSTTTDNEAGVATGWLPGQLSEQGLRNAAELGERRRNDHIAVVYCSDLRRAVQTAEVAFAGSGIEIRYDARLREVNYGELNGMPVAVLQAELSGRIDAPFAWQEGWEYELPTGWPGGVSRD